MRSHHASERGPRGKATHESTREVVNTCHGRNPSRPQFWFSVQPVPQQSATQKRQRATKVRLALEVKKAAPDMVVRETTATFSHASLGP